MKFLYSNPQASAKEVNAELRKQKKPPASPDTIISVRSRMRAAFPHLDFRQRRGRKSARLTKAQEAMLPRFSRAITWCLLSKILPSLQWSKPLQKECKAFVMSELPWLIQRYDKRKGSIWTYLLGRKGRIGRVRWLVKDFIRINLQAEMGLKRREVDLLLRIIREKNAPGRKTHAQIARKLKCSKQDVDELWRAYRDYLRIKSRSGQAKED